MEVLTEAVCSALGRESEPVTFEVERGDIRRFVEAIEDPNPLYTDERYARKTRYGGIIAPPTFLTAISNRKWVAENVMALDCPLKRILNAGNEIEMFQPIRPGDRITVRTKFVDAFVREGRSGKVLFLVYESTYTNQFGELVARTRGTFVRY